jgi:hypothetical protein
VSSHIAVNPEFPDRAVKEINAISVPTVRQHHANRISAGSFLIFRQPAPTLSNTATARFTNSTRKYSAIGQACFGSGSPAGSLFAA